MAGSTDSRATDCDSAQSAQSVKSCEVVRSRTILEHDYDLGGRLTQRRVTTLAGGFDGTVKRIGTSYLSRGAVDKVSQYTNAMVGSGSVTDEVQYAYDDWGNVSTFTQDVDSAIGGSGRASFAVTYTYAKATPTNAAPSVRCTAMTSPGESLTYEYLSSSNRLDDAAGRVSDVKAGATVVASYRYNGI